MELSRQKVAKDSKCSSQQPTWCDLKGAEEASPRRAAKQSRVEHAQRHADRRAQILSSHLLSSNDDDPFFTNDDDTAEDSYPRHGRIDDHLPLFVLPVYALPTITMTLVIFEPRYIAMMQRCLNSRQTMSSGEPGFGVFGMVAPQAGQEGPPRGATNPPPALRRIARRGSRVVQRLKVSSSSSPMTRMISIRRRGTVRSQSTSEAEEGELTTWSLP